MSNTTKRSITNAHVQPVILDIAGVKPTIPSPPTTEPEDDAWVNNSDILIGERAYNKVDDYWFYRDVNDKIRPIGKRAITITDADTINQNIDSWETTIAELEDTTRTTIALNFSNFFGKGDFFDLNITKNNGDLDLEFTLGGAGLIYNVFDSAKNINTRATKVVISGTDVPAGDKSSWELSFLYSGMDDSGDKIIQVVGTIDSFA